MTPPKIHPNIEAIGLRAMAEDDKLIRRQSILDAAERLWCAQFVRHSDTPFNMAEVANAAGLAKGTVYLYFESKEALMLALHEAHLEAFFNALDKRLLKSKAITEDEMVQLVQKHILGHPCFMGVCTVCMGAMEHKVPESLMLAHLELISDRLFHAGAGLARYYPHLSNFAGVEFLRDSYAMMLGLWQMLKIQHHSPALEKMVHVINPNFESYPVTAEKALRQMWRSRISEPKDTL